MSSGTPIPVLRSLLSASLMHQGSRIARVQKQTSINFPLSSPLWEIMGQMDRSFGWSGAIIVPRQS